MTLTLPPTALRRITSLLLDANASRYLSVAGLVALLYDHLLTLPKEIELIWKAPASAPKFAFLVNRYIVPSILLAVAYASCGFSLIPFDDAVRIVVITTAKVTRLADPYLQGCRKLLITAGVCAICSLGLANGLVLLRVVVLWDNNPTVKRLMTGGFLLSNLLTLGFMAATLSYMEPHFHYNPWARMCVTTASTPLLIGVWASPLIFEVLVLIATCWNALDRPTDGNMALIKSLQRDGIVFFLALTMLRAANLGLAVTRRPELVLFLVFFVWASTTLVLNRSLLSLQRATALNSLREAISNVPGRSSGSIVRRRLERIDSEGYESVTDIYEELEAWRTFRSERIKPVPSRWYM